MLCATHTCLRSRFDEAAGSQHKPMKEMRLNRRAYKINEVAESLSLSRTTIYKLIKRGDLKRIKLGASTLIAADSIDSLLQQNAI